MTAETVRLLHVIIDKLDRLAERHINKEGGGLHKPDRPSQDARMSTHGDNNAPPAPDALGERAPYPKLDLRGVIDEGRRRLLVITGCQATDNHLKCSFPHCTCKQIPAAVDAVLAAVTSPAPSPVAGMETTAEERAQWINSDHWYPSLRHCMEAACRDIDRQSAEIARSTGGET